MIHGMPAIGIRFDIDKVSEGSYGVACWKAFWRAIPPAQLTSSLLFEGDTASSMAGEENVYCIVVQSSEPEAHARIKAAIANNAALRRLCAVPPLVEDAACLREPLVEAGRIDSAGNLVGNAWNSRPALSAVRSE